MTPIECLVLFVVEAVGIAILYGQTLGEDELWDDTNSKEFYEDK